MIKIWSLLNPRSIFRIKEIWRYTKSVIATKTMTMTNWKVTKPFLNEKCLETCVFCFNIFGGNKQFNKNNSNNIKNIIAVSKKEKNKAINELRKLGISVDNISEVIAAGASSVAVISAVLGAESPEEASRQLSAGFEINRWVI